MVWLAVWHPRVGGRPCLPCASSRNDTDDFGTIFALTPALRRQDLRNAAYIAHFILRCTIGTLPRPPQGAITMTGTVGMTCFCRCLTLRDFTTGYLRGAPPSGCTAGSRISVTATVDALYSTRFISDFGFLCVNHVFLCSYSEWKSIRAHKGGLKNFRAGRRGPHGLLFGPQSSEEWRIGPSH